MEYLVKPNPQQLARSLRLAFFLAAALAAMVISIPAHGIDESKRGKVIDFEDEVVEGLNKRPLDSLSQISEANRKKRKPHLYRKRGGFRSETAETLRALKFTP